MSERQNVVVAMSGGVDSSVAAVLLVAAGYLVTGLMLRLWSESGYESNNRCCTPESVAEARRVAQKLGIPFYVIDASKIFRDIVVEDFLKGYSRGVTPNPCLICNRLIRWGFLWENALNMGAEFLASGHYARVKKNQQSFVELYRGVDLNKDQSYVLSVLTQAQLSKTILPLGGYSKPAVREMAAKFGLAVAERAESQDLCFLGGEDYRSFLARYIPSAFVPGKIIDQSGKVIGQHAGLANYTVGQRRGIQVPSQTPLYVLEKRVDENVIIVGEESALGHRRLLADQVNWISGEPLSNPFTAGVKVRYRSPLHDATVIPFGIDRVEVEFESPVRDITPGQRAVFYCGEQVIGGGNIDMGYD